MESKALQQQQLIESKLYSHLFHATYNKKCLSMSNKQASTSAGSSNLAKSEENNSSSSSNNNSNSNGNNNNNSSSSSSNSSKKSSGSNSSTTLIVEFLKNIKLGSNVMNVSVPAILMSGLSLLETTARTNAPTASLLNASTHTTPMTRFLSIVKYLYNSVHFQSVDNGYMRSKPFNPILGERFHCSWQHFHEGRIVNNSTVDSSSNGDEACSATTRLINSVTEYHSEQVSHHPPVSAYHMVNTLAGFEVNSTIGVNVSIGFNKCTSVTSGLNVVKLTKWNETYKFTRPNTVVHQLLIGTGYIRPANTMTVTCEETGLSATLTFSSDSKVFGQVLEHGKVLYTIPSGSSVHKFALVEKKSGTSQSFWNSESDKESANEPIVAPIALQQEHESRRVWHTVTEAIAKENYTVATEEKLKVEAEARRKRQQDASQWKPSLFTGHDGVENNKHKIVEGVHTHVYTNRVELLQQQTLQQ